MTRLKPCDIEIVSSQLEAYDRELIRKTGYNLRDIAGYASGVSSEKFQGLPGKVKMAVVPITAGQGTIRGFSQVVANIVAHIGFDVFVTNGTDVSGLAEAVECGAEVVFMADDSRFVALNVKSGRMVDNAGATAKGFVGGLDLMTGGLRGKRVLVIGCGPVGKSAVLAAISRGAIVSVFDIDDRRSRSTVREVGGLTGVSVGIERSFEDALKDHSLLVEATNAAGVIVETFIRPDTYIAAPGMPLGLTSAAVEKISDRLLHDPLQLGVAVMAIEASLPSKEIL
jgi:pyrrolysine biosynthesis protein PylD